MLQTDDYERGYAAGKDKMLSEILQRAEDPEGHTKGIIYSFTQAKRWLFGQSYMTNKVTRGLQQCQK